MKNTGQICRSKKNAQSRYTMIDNAILQSWELTPEEKSILIYLLSMPENWIVIKRKLIEDCNIGRDRFNRAWKGLQEKGYIQSIRVIDLDTKQIKGWNHIVYEEPILPELLKTRESENPKVGDSESREIRESEIQSVYKETNKQNTELTNKELIQSNNPTKGEGVLELIFEEVWKFYSSSASRQVGSKKDARAKFLRLKSNEIESIRVHLPKYVKNHLEAKKTDYLPNLTTYLNKRSYEDEKLPYPSATNKMEDYLNQFKGL
jgi:hypothetical protein